MSHLYHLTLAGAMILGSLASAQTVFTPANAAPDQGDYIYSWHNRQGGPASPIDTNATTSTWDFTALVFLGSFEFTVTVAPASNTPHAALAPGSDVAWIYRSSTRDDYFYYQNGPDSLLVRGELSELFGDGVYEAPVCRTVRLVYPAAVGDAFTEQESSECNGDNRWRLKVIATGTLQTSLGNFSNVVLVKESALEDIGGGTVETFLRYLWFSPNNALEPFALWSPAANTFQLNILTPAVGIAEAGTLQDFNLFPNPATNRITLQRRDGRALGEVRIHATDGRVVRAMGRIGTGQLDLDVVDLPAGLYTLIATTEGQRSTMRFVKQ